MRSNIYILTMLFFLFQWLWNFFFLLRFVSFYIFSSKVCVSVFIFLFHNLQCSFYVLAFLLLLVKFTQYKLYAFRQILNCFSHQHNFPKKSFYWAYNLFQNVNFSGIFIVSSHMACLMWIQPRSFTPPPVLWNRGLRRVHCIRSFISANFFSHTLYKACELISDWQESLHQLKNQ